MPLKYIIGAKSSGMNLFNVYCVINTDKEILKKSELKKRRKR